MPFPHHRKRGRGDNDGVLHAADHDTWNAAKTKSWSALWDLSNFFVGGKGYCFCWSSSWKKKLHDIGVDDFSWVPDVCLKMELKTPQKIKQVGICKRSRRNLVAIHGVRRDGEILWPKKYWEPKGTRNPAGYTRYPHDILPFPYFKGWLVHGL